jgi:hypothetical protein
MCLCLFLLTPLARSYYAPIREVVNDMRFGWQNKIGLVASKVGASIVFTIPRIVNPIRVFTIHYMKSYGEKWAGSAAKFDLEALIQDTAASSYQFASSFTKSFTLSG